MGSDAEPARRRPPLRRAELLLPRRVATISVHTSPLEQPGSGDAGGMNVYVLEVAKRLAGAGVEVEIFTRATASDQDPTVELAPGLTVRHVSAGPYEGLAKEDLPGRLCAFTAGVLRAEATRDPGHYDLVHSHYWLSGQVGWLAAQRWGIPLVHSMHTMAKVKNAALADGDTPEPRSRELGETDVVAAADRLLAFTQDEARALVELYDAGPDRVDVVPPGVDLATFTAGHRAAARAALGLPVDAEVLLFAGRIQPLKAPDVLLRAVAALVDGDGARRERMVVAVVGGPSGSGLAHPEQLAKLGGELGIGDLVRFAPPVPQPDLARWYQAADVTVVPSYSESFGLVAIESQACGTPVVAARVGGLTTAVADGVSGLLIDGHDPADYAAALHRLLSDEVLRRRLGDGAVRHAARFDWSATADAVLKSYARAMDATAHPRLPG
ncbi:MAG TPA: D-inositol-3-phosphate glycosyltransferase [Sporichthyaceae bacterium]|nr:D-inositol-3-phosphate glycosyltransferase [Sporichthyaceae bacterium]